MDYLELNWPKTLKTIGLHLLFWILIVTYFAWGFGLDENPKKSFINSAYFLPGHMIMAYALIYILIPKFLLKRKFIQFALGLFCVILLCIAYTILAQLSINNTRDFSGMTFTVGRNVLPFLHVGGFVVSIKLLQYWYIQKQETIEAERQKSVAELKLLRAQLHPHFLFNTLNNLYSHTLKQSAKAPEIVLKLSALLRFMIYESNSARISLKKEIDLLQNYIDLEQLRYGDRLEISKTISGDIKQYQIAPLLLLPFLENAFKHGTSQQIDQCWIRLDLNLQGSKMIFKLVNSIDPNTKKTFKNIGGLGLQNVERRLQLIYKDKYHFETIHQNEVFIVNLDILLEALEDEFKEKLIK
ncbi:sensor histidine kinase [Formosa haliotis]|uniref:sensor histidine kinase n=1 Tax=Formosa haliotis TaxID=1555194 RepID=UPI000826FA1D|nr:histidine kinase [Formosa haliotis]